MDIKKYSGQNPKTGLVQEWIKDNGMMLVASPDGIVFFKDNIGTVVINEFQNNHRRYDLKDSEPKKGYYYNFLFEYNKPYFIYLGGKANAPIKMFVKDGENILCYYDSIYHSLSLGEKSIDEEIVLTKEEIEAKFNKDNYDFMCIFFDNTIPIYVNSGNLTFGKKLDFSDDVIIQKDLENRQFHYSFNYNSSSNQGQVESRPIEEIENLKLYSSIIFNKYAHFLLTSKDGVFSLMRFNVVFVEKDKFRLTYSVVPINIPTIDEIISYARGNEIETMSVMLDEEFYIRDEEDALFKRLHTMLNPKTDFGTTTPQEETPKKGKLRDLIPSWRKKPRKPQ